MDNRINFTGIYNTGAMRTMATNVETGMSYSRFHLCAQLVDDNLGKDLTEFRHAVSKCKNSVGPCMFLSNPTILNIRGCRDGLGRQSLFVNNEIIPVKNATMPLFDYVAKLTRSLVTKPDNDFVVYDAFKYGIAGDRYTIGEHALSDVVTDGSERKVILDNIFDTDNVKEGAKALNEFIQNMMEEFFK